MPHDGQVTRRWVLPLLSAVLCALAVGVVVVQALSTPAIAAPPGGPTDREVDAYVQNMLDATWDNSGLAESMERPAAVDVPLLTEDVWGDAFYSCMTGLGFELVSYGWSASAGYELYNSDGSRVEDPKQQLAFYECVAKNPRDPRESGELISPEALEYTYDYFSRWTIPCIEANGYIVNPIMLRDEYVAEGSGGFGWSPYMSVAELTEPLDYERLSAVCGPASPLG